MSRIPYAPGATVASAFQTKPPIQPPVQYKLHKQVCTNSGKIITSVTGDSEQDIAYRVERNNIAENIACYLNQLYQHRIQSTFIAEGYQAFFAQTVSKINIGCYFMRLVTILDLSANCIIHAIWKIYNLYTKRNKDSLNIITPLSIHRFVLVALLVSMKYCDDECMMNSDFAVIGGVTLKELNFMEVEFVSVIEFDLYLSEEMHISLHTALSDQVHHYNCKHVAMPPYRILDAGITDS